MSHFPSWLRRFVPIRKASRPAPRRRSRIQPRIERLEDRCLLSTIYTVTSLGDGNTLGTLRYAINQANANHTGTAVSPDQIQFTTSGGTIDVSSADGGALPALASNEVAIIDGTTATGYNGTPVITLDGSNAGAGANGLTVSGGSSTVKGLDIINFSGNGIQLDTNGNDQVLSCEIGLTTAGVAAANGQNGIFIDGTAGNTVGGAATGAGNVISGNNGDGILIDGPAASENQIIDNLIGTDATGATAVGNGGNGIEIRNGANRNTIGGNTPTTTAFTGKPEDGNVISGNVGDGVLLTSGAEFNTLSGNFIGSDLAGTSGVGNNLDGVAIVDANNNSLIGTTFPQQPFVYLNLVCANGGNGLRIDDSNNTTVQANSFGLADNNATPLGNHLDGVLIDGTSTNTQFGGVIPLGNISAGNGKNGVEIADSASGTVVFNTFCGLPAFVDAAVGNAQDGILITSTGGNNLLRTNVISGNGGNGVHISGDATGVQVAEDIIGMDTNGALPLPNAGDGILIDDSAHDNLIGGEQVSVILQNTISSNGGNGIAIVGNASNNQIFHSFIGTNIEGLAAYGNAGAGVLIGGSAQNNTLGGTGYFDQNVISGNLGGGIQLNAGSQGTQVIGNLIGTDRNGQTALDNDGNGIGIAGSNNQIGGVSSGMGNVIAFNTQNGVAVAAGTANAILDNSIFRNAALGIVLTDGGNANQPAPVLTTAEQLTSTTVQITGTLTAAANTAYTLEFFTSANGIPPGQGQTLLGSLGVTTNSNGTASFTFGAPLSTLSGVSFTATATDAAGNTSPFSNALFASTPNPSPSPSPTPSPTPPVYTPVSPLTPFGFGIGAGLQLEIFDVDTYGQVFAQSVTAFVFGGDPLFVNRDLIFSDLQWANGSLVGLLQYQGTGQGLVDVLNFGNTFVFDAVLAAIRASV
jgi:hypothetical protein